VLLAGLTALVLHVARGRGLLTPVAVGLALRLVAMVGVHLASVADGGSGFLFSDDRAFYDDAALLADRWREGRLASPIGVADSYQAGFQAITAAVFFLTGPSLIAGKLLSVATSAATVLLAGLVAGRVAGPGAARTTAWVVALMPTLVFWATGFLKEPVVGFIALGALLAITALSRPVAALVAIAATGALVSVRGLVGVALAVASVAGYGVALVRYRHELRIRRLLRPLAVVVVVGVVALFAVAGGDPSALVDGYANAADSMFDEYQGASPASIPVDVVRAAVSPRPWVFDESEGAAGWYRALYPGMLFLYVLYPLAAVGAWRMRRRPAILLLLAFVVTVVAAHAAISGSGVRQRSSVEPLIALLAVCAAPSWQTVARAGAGVAALVAVAALVDTGSPAFAALLPAAAALWWLAARLPDRRPALGDDPEPLRVELRSLCGRTGDGEPPEPAVPAPPGRPAEPVTSQSGSPVR
jgi:4-amino-4-deoxy-L-arabinose transferase-like glycosyltransferase